MLTEEAPLSAFDSLWRDNPPLVIVGSTSVGKTAVAMALAEMWNAEIINADSMQVYIGMDIGTAKPTYEERERVPFYLLDIVEPDVQFTVSEWKLRAEQAFGEIIERGKRVIVCGGTGLYIRSLLDNWTLAKTPENPDIRAVLREELASVGANVLHERLCEVDSLTAQRLHPNDGVRIVRALEVFQITGVPISEWQAQDNDPSTRRFAHRFGLTIPRPELYARIDARVLQMMEAGFEREVRSLLEKGVPTNLTALKSLGYKELVAYLNGESDYRTAVEAIQQNTRHYAKRQQTWFRADPHIEWLDVSNQAPTVVALRILRDLLWNKSSS
ncbi:MAG: tRNA (adenosine(37)-N6)-dimethylallyltransferase MiaA [Armatimonadetes bacterium]|nr:tRNA (adenosine(37)-N6)-dimethylallyltransferase MiaA [Armatimonadota bacterium]